jgi:hypothetical protein
MTPEEEKTLKAEYEIRHAREMKEAAEVQKRGHTITMHFDSDDDAQEFVGWYLDGGGDQGFDHHDEFIVVWDHRQEVPTRAFTHLRHKSREERDE